MGNVAELAPRLERLERKLKRQRFVGLCIAMILCALVLVGQVPTTSQPAPGSGKTISAEKIVLLDEEGRERAVLGIFGASLPNLVFQDENGRRRTVISDNAIGFYEGESPHPAATLSANGLRLRDENYKTILSLEVDDKGWPELALYGRSVMPRMTLSVTPVGKFIQESLKASGEKFVSERCAIQISQPTFASRNIIEISESLSGDAEIILNRRTEEEVRDVADVAKIAGEQAGIRLTANVDGHASLKLADTDGFYSVLGCVDLVTKKTGAKTKTSGASLTLFDNKGSVIWDAP